MRRKFQLEVDSELKKKQIRERKNVERLRQERQGKDGGRRPDHSLAHVHTILLRRSALHYGEQHQQPRTGTRDAERGRVDFVMHQTDVGAVEARE